MLPRLRRQTRCGARRSAAGYCARRRAPNAGWATPEAGRVLLERRRVSDGTPLAAPEATGRSRDRAPGTVERTPIVSSNGEAATRRPREGRRRSWCRRPAHAVRITRRPWRYRAPRAQLRASEGGAAQGSGNACGSTVIPRYDDPGGRCRSTGFVAQRPAGNLGQGAASRPGGSAATNTNVTADRGGPAIGVALTVLERGLSARMSSASRGSSGRARVAPTRGVEIGGLTRARDR